MHTSTPGHAGFKRQVVFRIGTDDWPLLETAARDHGSIQAALLAGLHALHQPPKPPPAERAAAKAKSARTTAKRPARAPAPTDPNEELRARQAAELLGLKSSTVRGYIRSGRINGRYDEERGWVTTRAVVAAYARGR